MAENENFSVIYNTLFPKISKSLESPSNIRGVQNFFRKVVDSSNNSEALSMAVPYKSLFVNRKDENDYFNCIGIDRREVIKVIDDSPYVGDNWKTVRNDMYVSLILVAIYFYRHKKEQMFKQTMFIWSLYMYKSVKSHYFKSRQTGENSLRCMEYTLGRLSYKNDLKKFKSIQGTLDKKTEVFISNWFDGRGADLKGNIEDVIICRMIDDNYSRYKKLLTNFAVEFYKDLEAGNYLNIDQDIDDGEQFIQSDNVSFMVEKTTQKIMNKFILSIAPNERIIQQVVAREPGCSANNLRNMTHYIYDNHEKDFEKLVRVIIQIYLFEYKKQIEDIKTFDFEMTMRKHYKGQSSSDKNLNELKGVIDKVMEDSGLNDRISRQATKNDCKRAFLLYVLVYIRYALLS